MRKEEREKKKTEIKETKKKNKKTKSKKKTRKKPPFLLTKRTENQVVDTRNLPLLSRGHEFAYHVGPPYLRTFLPCRRLPCKETQRDPRLNTHARQDVLGRPTHRRYVLLLKTYSYLSYLHARSNMLIG